MKTRALLTIIGISLGIACGGDDSPTSPSQTIVDVAGVWATRETLTGVSGGECVGLSLQAGIGGTTGGTLSITQSGASLTATSTSDASGLSCTYTGTAGASSVTLNATTCTANSIVGLQCANGARRDMELVAAAINGTVAGSTVTGTAAQTWNVYLAGTRTNAGLLTLNSSFNATRR